MQKSRCNRLLIHLEIRQDDGDTKRMDDVRLTRFSLLILMLLRRYPISLLDHRKVIRWMITLDRFNQILI